MKETILFVSTLKQPEKHDEYIICASCAVHEASIVITLAEKVPHKTYLCKSCAGKLVWDLTEELNGEDVGKLPLDRIEAKLSTIERDISRIHRAMGIPHEWRNKP